MSMSRRLMLGASILAALTAPASATAARPDITRVSFEDRYVDTQTCPGMALDTQLEASVAIQLFSATRAQVHQRFVYTVSADGKTFTDNESFMEFADPTSCVSRFSGTEINIPVSGGETFNGEPIGGIVEVGSYDFLCTIHLLMNGEVTVVA